MNNAQKVIKYVAIVFAISLIASIFASILTGVFALLGVDTVIDVISDSVEVMDYAKEYSNVYSIQLDISTADLEIIPADKLKIEGTSIPTDYEFKEENGKLKIKNKKAAKNSKLVIYLSTEVKELDIDVGAGKIQMEDLTIQEVSLYTGAATANITKLTVTSKMDIDAGVGDIVITEADISNLNIDAGVGNVQYIGFLRGVSKVNCGIGNMELSLYKTEEMYKITAEKGVGELKVNDVKLSGIQTLGNGSNIIKLSGGIGNLNVTY